jgi:clan AA aspartic protease (TIGR02281 family)
MNRTFKAAVAALVLAVGFAGSAAAQQPGFVLPEALPTSRFVLPEVLKRERTDKLLADAAVAYQRGDYATAIKWYRKAAEQGDAFAQYNLGGIYQNGQGVPQNYSEAIKWFSKAATQGAAGAQARLASMYFIGLGVQQDYAAAASWYRKAAEQGHARAQYGLGLMYGSGQGVLQNYVLAYMWLNLAAGGRLEIAAEWRNTVAARMTPVQIAEAQKLASEWHPKITGAAPKQATQGHVPLKLDGGTFIVPVQINGTMTLDFVVDSGASDVSVPADVVSTLMRAGTIKETDFIGEQTYILADGSKSQSPTFMIRSLRVGDVVLENVKGSIAPSQGSLLLGQSFLKRFKSWSIDNTEQKLLLEPH